MGSIMNFLIALEAEDITKDVDKEMKKAVGNKSIKSTLNKDDREDMGKTDDILGTNTTKKDNKVDKKAPKDDSLGDDLDAPEDDLGDEDPTGDDTDITDTEDPDVIPEDGSEPDPTDTDPNNPETADTTENTDNELDKKIALRENMILFYNILSSNIKLLSEYSPDKEVLENTDALSTVSKNFVECKTILFNIITEELESKTYVELLRKYIALNRVYDLNIRILDTYFSDLKLLSTKNKK